MKSNTGMILTVISMVALLGYGVALTVNNFTSPNEWNQK